MTANRKKIVRAVVILLGLAAAVWGGLAYYIFNVMDPTRDSVDELDYTLTLDSPLTRDQAAADLQYLYGHLRDYHPAWLDGSTEMTDAVQSQYDEELAALPGSVTVLELWQAAARIAARLSDGHTSVWYKGENSGDLYLSDLTQMQAYGRPTAVNGVPTDEIYETFKSRFSYELEPYARSVFEDAYLVYEPYLRFCGVDTSDGVVFTYDTEDGPEDYHYDFVEAAKVGGKIPETSDAWVAYQIDTDRNLGIFTLKECNYNAEYMTTLNAFFQAVAAQNITNLVVDLRGNGGGSSMVANAFLSYIDVKSYQSWDSAVRYGWYLAKNTDIVTKNQRSEPTFNGHLYVLTDVRTYSSAMDFAMLIGDNDLGTLVGAASGNLPDSYGDRLTFQLPNSGLCLRVSYKKWGRVDKAKAGEPLTPDYECDPDRALDTVYSLIGKEPPES